MRLLADAPQTATQIAAELPVSRQAVAKHLATLEDAGLVAGERLGREVRYRLTPRPMADAVLWMTDTAAEWDRRLEALRRHLKR
jgi:DNA-binding transcriptional ArsR family regulator